VCPSNLRTCNTTPPQAATNVAYLRHVVLSFLLAQDEQSAIPTRERLLPVIGQLLDLSPQETAAAADAVNRQSALLRAGSRPALFVGGGLSSLWGGGGGGAGAPGHLGVFPPTPEKRKPPAAPPQDFSKE